MTREDETMNEHTEYFVGYIDYLDDDDPDELVSLLYNSLVADSCEEIPGPLAARAWETHRETFWGERLSTESSGRICELVPFV
jgi:hypothetical protein